MFSITVLVEDKQLPKLLWLLDGVILDEPKIRPVRGATVTRGRVKSSQPVPGASLPEQVAAQLQAFQGQTISGNALRDIIEQSGGKRDSSPYVLGALKKAKIVSHKKGARTITVLKRKA